MSGRAGIICAGNWIVDLVHDIDHWPAESELTRIGRQARSIGGGAANVITALAKLDTGLPLWPMGAIGDDAYGAFIQQACGAMDLPVSQLSVKPGVATAHTHVMSVPGQSRTFFYQGGANDVLDLADFPAGTFAQTKARVFYLGYLTLLGALDRIDAYGATGAARVLERAKAAGLITVVDLVSGQHSGFGQIIRAAAPFVDYFVMNEVEAARATGLSGVDRGALTDMGRALVAMGVGKAAVIHCPDFAVWVGADDSVLVADVTPLPPDQIVGHLGAGDAFCAGLIHGLHDGWAPPRALALANATARASLGGVSAAESIPPLGELDPGAAQS